MAGDFNSVVFVDQFQSSVIQLSQQTDMRIAQQAEQRRLEGKSLFWERAAPTEMVQVTSDFQDTPYIDVPFSRRVVIAKDFAWASPYTQQQDFRARISYENALASSAAYALNREKDQTVINAFDGNALGGEDGTTVIPFDASQEVDAAGPITLDTLRDTLQLFNKNDVDPALPKFWVYAPQQVTDLLSITEVTNIDFNTQKALTTGNPVSFLGFTFIMSNLLPVDGSNIRKNFAWTPSGMGFAEGLMEMSMDRLPTKLNATQVMAQLSVGAVRLEDKKVVRILADETP